MAAAGESRKIAGAVLEVKRGEPLTDESSDSAGLLVTGNVPESPL